MSGKYKRLCIFLDEEELTEGIPLFNLVTRLGGAKNLSCKVLELHLADACQ